MRTALYLFAIPASLLALYATADVSKVNQKDLLQAMDVAPIAKTNEQDDGCNLTRYKFLDDTVGVTVEFRCNRITVAWINAQDADLADKVKKNRELATKAVAALSGGNGHEVDQAIDGEVFRGKSLLNGLELRGSCPGDMCLLTFK
ncbi:hypothetical protein [Pseudomonas aeruginosa]|uniref:hypothetical protein n=1 Tax=Pseudomonas aeruginosa TaxID=287 RepID=UPI003CC504E6|nr:hypothetical protein [Pseudomonas aeruginosa]